MDRHHRVFLVRHGIRAFPEPAPPTPPVSNSPDCLLLLASEENLNYFGHKYSRRLGKFIRKNYGKPDFIYGDATMNRTIDTSINLAIGAKKNKIHLSRQNPDPFFQYPKTITPSTIKAANKILNKSEPLIQEIKKACEKLQPCLHLTDSSAVDPVTDNVTGLAIQEYVLGSIMFFSAPSKIPNPLLEKQHLIGQIETIVWRIRGPTIETIKAPAEVLLNGISKFIQKNDLSVLVGHEHNIIQISQLLEKEYKLPGYPNLFVQANSGFIFTLYQKYLEIEIIYLSHNLTFKTFQYGKI